MRHVLAAVLILSTMACGGSATGGGDDVPGEVDAGAGRDGGGDPGSERWVTGYYVGYQRDLYPPAAVDYASLTHLVVGRITPRADGGLTSTFDIDATQGPAMARDLATRARAAGVTSILMIGGAGEHDNWVSAAAPARRTAFVGNLLAAMDAYGYDGLDLDWEPITAADEAPLRQLIADLRAARPSIVLTLPVGWVGGGETVSPFYAQVARQLDQINLMTYSMADAWPGWVTWHSSALRGAGARNPSSVGSSIDAYRGAGVPAGKLGVGIGYYGSCWAGGATAPGQEPTGGVVASDNEMSYAAIMDTYHQPSAYQYDPTAEAPYLAWAGGNGPRRCTFLSYEDERSIAAKGAYVRAEGLGGAIIWTINQGYRSAAAGGARGALLTATAAAFR